MPYQYKREPLTSDEATWLANACQSHQEKLVVWTLLDTGLRVAELAGLKKENIYWQQKRLTIYGKGGALDHVVASAGMQEAVATARVTGYCALAGCADIAGAMPAATERLSDHCPVVVDIQDRDLD